MIYDYGTTAGWLLYASGLLLVPILVPITSSVTVGWLLPTMNAKRTLLWGIPLGVLNVPFSLAALRFGIVVWDPVWEGYGWGTWLIAMVISAALTALLTWAIARMKVNCREVHDGS